MGDNNQLDNDVVPAGAKHLSGEREHRHPTAEQARSIGHRRRDAEAKLEQHLREARDKA
ncbi:hypothetical protein ACFVYC_19955 [Pseudarthrobacter sp. NPDC058329]|uniref:hypothetical protein n=1 Tax=Pseudarthrobacter sp. NPDC058329 TaxID=3346448 RepID=UPI0036D94650